MRPLATGAAAGAAGGREATPGRPVGRVRLDGRTVPAPRTAGGGIPAAVPGAGAAGEDSPPVPRVPGEPARSTSDDTPQDPAPFRFDATPEAAPSTARERRESVSDVRHGTAGLPEAVRRTRARLLDAAATGEIERLRPIFAAADTPPITGFAPVPDPIDHLRRQSGDRHGREILAILIELLSAGWVRVDAGTPRETYVWPYFAHVPLGSLSPAEEVELYKIVTAVDVEEMEAIGGWAFYRVGIAPDGAIRYLSADGF